MNNLANVILYHRTATTPASDPLYNTVAKLLAAKPAQCLEFIFPNDMLEGSRKRYENNIKHIPSSTPDGTRKASTQENGLKSSTLILRGNFKNPDADTDLKKLEIFAISSQIDTLHVFGHIGFFSPNATRLTLDPTPTIGYTIDYIETGRIGQRGSIYDFEVGLSIGGTIPVPT